MNLSKKTSVYASLESHSCRRPGKKEQISDTETELEERLSIFERYSTISSLFQVTHMHACAMHDYCCMLFVGNGETPTPYLPILLDASKTYK